MGYKLQIGVTAFVEEVRYHGTMMIDTSAYPQMDGMTEEECIDYIKENAETLEPYEDEFGFDSLYEQLQERDIVNTKILDNEYELYVNY